MAKGFDRLAGIYDRLAALVYGRSLRRAQTCLLGELPGHCRVLVLGGGTGWALEAMLEKLEGIEVTYVELSGKMLDKSRARIQKGLPGKMGQVEWLEGTVHDLPLEQRFDLVCTHCFLDLFGAEGLQVETEAIGMRMRENAMWYFSDFKYAERGLMQVLSRLLIWGMYWFFRRMCRIPARRLGNFHEAIEGQGFERRRQTEFFGGMIEAAIFQRKPKK